GDTGADCLGTTHRHKAKSVHQFEIMPMPPEARAPSTPWPLWPLQLRSESSHEEGGLRDWSIGTTHFAGDDNGNVKQLHAIRVGARRWGRESSHGGSPMFDARTAASSGYEAVLWSTRMIQSAAALTVSLVAQAGDGAMDGDKTRHPVVALVKIGRIRPP